MNEKKTVFERLLKVIENYHASDCTFEKRQSKSGAFCVQTIELVL